MGQLIQPILKHRRTIFSRGKPFFGAADPVWFENNPLQPSRQPYPLRGWGYLFSVVGMVTTQTNNSFFFERFIVTVLKSTDSFYKPFGREDCIFKIILLEECLVPLYRDFINLKT